MEIWRYGDMEIWMMMQPIEILSQLEQYRVIQKE
jgi:hypothetical protein